MNRKSVKEELEKWMKAYENSAPEDGLINSFSLSEPATEEELSSKEKELGVKIPKSLRDFFKNISAGIVFEFTFDDYKRKELPHDFRYLDNSNMEFGLEVLDNSQYSQIMDTIKNNPDEPWTDDFGQVWKDKLAFVHLGNGDVIAIDLASESGESVVFISHYDDKATEIAPNFTMFFEGWLKAGLVNPSYVGIFLTDGESNEKTKIWRKIMLGSETERAEIIREYKKTVHEKPERTVIFQAFVALGVIVVPFLILFLIGMFVKLFK